jgi:hypothetical protein
MMAKLNNNLIQAPGTLIKPKTEKARGRPKLHIDVIKIKFRLLKMICLMAHLTLNNKWSRLYMAFQLHITNM